jgi:esterase/lipase superfamily enzyme
MRYVALVFTFLFILGCKPRTSETESETLDFPVDARVAGDDDAFETVSLFYGTNRRVDEKTLQMDGKHYVSAEKIARLDKVFSGDRHYPFEGRDDPLTDNNHYGMVEVSIPKNHRRGKQEFASASKFKVTDHIGLINIWLYENGEDFETKVKSIADQTSSKDIFVMIHGYNVTFKNAAEFYGTFIYDTNFRGLPFLYTWSSDGHTGGYSDDEDDVSWSETGFSIFMDRVWKMQKNLGGKVHILAHSMGNRLLLRHLYSIREKYDLKTTNPPFENVIFAAPDVDGTEFSDKFVRSKHLGKQFTLYANGNDLALRASNLKHNWWRRFAFAVGLSEIGSADRAGTSGKKKIMSEKLDTIDLTPLKTGGLGHCDFATNPAVIQDIDGLLNSGLKVEERLQRFQTLVLTTETHKQDQRAEAGLPFSFYQFKVETPLASFEDKTTRSYSASIYRLNAANSLYLKLFDKERNFLGDFTFSRAAGDSYKSRWGLDGLLALTPSKCQVNIDSRLGSYSYVLASQKDSFGCKELEKIVAE